MGRHMQLSSRMIPLGCADAEARRKFQLNMTLFFVLVLLQGTIQRSAAKQ